MGARLAVTEAQAGVWFAQQLRPDDSSFNVGEYFEIRGPVDPALLEAALRQVVDETEALRGRFELAEDGLCQVIADAGDWAMQFVDVSGEPDPCAAAERRMAEDLALEFDLARGPLFSFALLKVEADLYFWYQAVHHVALDGFGLSIIAARVAAAYTALATGVPRPELPPGNLRDVLEEEERYTASEQFAEDRRYWLAQLENRPEPTSPAGWTPPERYAFVRRSAQVTPAWLDWLRLLARRFDVTWPELVVATAAVHLHRETGARDLVLSLPVTARTTPLLRRTPAMLSNVVPLRLRVRPELGCGALVEQTSQALLAARRHQRYRQERLVREVPGLADGRRQFGPDVNIMSFDYHLSFAGCPARAHNLSAGPVEDLSTQVYDRFDGSGIRVDVDGNAERYGPADLAEYLQRFLRLLAPDSGLSLGRRGDRAEHRW